MKTNKAYEEMVALKDSYKNAYESINYDNNHLKDVITILNKTILSLENQRKELQHELKCQEWNCKNVVESLNIYSKENEELKRNIKILQKQQNNANEYIDDLIDRILVLEKLLSNATLCQYSDKLIEKDKEVEKLKLALEDKENEIIEKTQTIQRLNDALYAFINQKTQEWFKRPYL